MIQSISANNQNDMFKFQNQNQKKLLILEETDCYF